MTFHRTHRAEIVGLKNVSLSYPERGLVLSHLSYSFETGGFYFLTGPSGTGKTSLLKLIYKGLTPTEGVIHVFGKDLETLPTRDLYLFRQRMGLVFQDCSLLAHLTILDNVALAMRISGADTKRSRACAEELLHWVGLQEYLFHLPSMLSDGQKQRAAIARAVITRPLLILADEPTGSVDDAAAYKLMLLFEELNKMGTTVIMATHNRGIVTAFPYPELHLYQGKLTVQDNQKFLRDGSYD